MNKTPDKRRGFPTGRVVFSAFVILAGWAAWEFFLGSLVKEHTTAFFLLLAAFFWVSSKMKELLGGAILIIVLTQIFLGPGYEWILTVVGGLMLLSWVWSLSAPSSEKTIPPTEREKGTFESIASGMTGAYVFGEHASTVKRMARWFGQ